MWAWEIYCIVNAKLICILQERRKLPARLALHLPVHSVLGGIQGLLRHHHPISMIKYCYANAHDNCNGNKVFLYIFCIFFHWSDTYDHSLTSAKLLPEEHNDKQCLTMYVILLQVHQRIPWTLYREKKGTFNTCCTPQSTACTGTRRGNRAGSYLRP